MIRLTKKSLMMAALSVSVTVIAGTACAGEEKPPPPKGVICHNIGGPRDLGADCDMTGNCTFETEEGGTILVTPNNYLGIIIGASDNAEAAHIAHGDGFANVLFDPPLHLASVIGPHRASNVECMATRIIPQPDEPGN